MRWAKGRKIIATAAVQGPEHGGETRGAENHDHDLIQDLGKRLDAPWRYDQYLANPDGEPRLQECWRTLKSQEQENVRKLKELIAEEIRRGCF